MRTWFFFVDEHTFFSGTFVPHPVVRDESGSDRAASHQKEIFKNFFHDLLRMVRKVESRCIIEHNYKYVNIFIDTFLL